MTTANDHKSTNSQCPDTRCQDTPCQDTQWTADDVANQLEEALLTLKKLPPVRVQGYFSVWPEGAYSLQELLGQEVQPIRLTATPAAITRLEQTLSWMHWVSIKERKLLWCRAARLPWKAICFRLGFSRTTVWRKWLVSLSTIADRLNGMAATAPMGCVLEKPRTHKDRLQG